jgi:hypothetical protein
MISRHYPNVFFPLETAITVVQILHGLENSQTSVDCQTKNLTGCLAQVLSPESLRKCVLNVFITVAAKCELLGDFGSLCRTLSYLKLPIGDIKNKK